MSDMHDSLEIAKGLAPYVLGGGAAFWIKKWIGRTDDSIQELVKAVQDINLKLAVYNEHRLQRDETISDLKKRLEYGERDLQKLNGTIQSVWSILKPSKCSDEPLKHRT